MHQNDSVTKKPLPADPADVQRMKGKLQSVPKVTPLNPPNGGASAAATAVPVPSSGATSRAAPVPVLQISMLRVDRQQLEPEPEPVRRHPVANWRPHSGPTEEKHPRFLLTMPEPEISICLHMAGQHTEHIVFGANQYACWLRCSLCEKTSPRIFYRYTICYKCPLRRLEDYQSLWQLSTRCVLMKWNCLLLRLFWMGTEDTRAYFAQELRDLSQHGRFAEVDDSETMEVFHETIELESRTTQTSCDLQWAPPTRHAVLNEETADLGLIPGACGPTGSVQQPFPVTDDGSPLEQPRFFHMSDNLRTEVSLLNTEQEPTSLADRFSRGGLPFTVGPLHGGLTMEEDFPYAEIAEVNEDKLDETRSNEAHPRHVVHQQDPYSTQGPCPSKPFEGLEQCLSWHQQVWNYLFHACPCHRRRCVDSQFEEPLQPRVVDGYASHRGYPILKPPHTTKQALTRVRDRVQDQERYDDLGLHPGLTDMRDIAPSTSLSRLACRRITRVDGDPGVPPYSAGMDMRSGGTTSNFDRISAIWHGVMGTGHTEYDTSQGHSLGVPSTYLASRPLLRRDGQDSEGTEENQANHTDSTVREISDHEDSRRLASGLPADLSGLPGTEAQGSHLRVDRSVLGRQADPGDRRTSDRRSSTPGSDVVSPSTGRPMCVSPTLICSSSGSQQQMQRPENFEGFRGSSIEPERDITGNASRILMTGLRHPGQRGVTTLSGADDDRELRRPMAHHSRWLWAKLLQEEYPSEGYFMNTTGLRTGNGSWFRPNIALRDIPKRLMMLLSGTDNRRTGSEGYSGNQRIISEAEELQARAREYTRRQLEGMDDWDRAFYQEWTSLISRNALAYPYPLGEPRESSKVKLRRSWQRRSVATRDISPRARVTSGRDLVPSPRRQWTSQLGRYDPREQRVLGHHGDGLSHITGSPVYYSLQGLEFRHPTKGNGVEKKSINRTNSHDGNR